MTPLHFRKSSYSGQGQNCLEVARLPADYRTSSRSGHDENCVEVADLPLGAAVRDSKHPEVGPLAFPSEEWAAFLAAARRGEL